MPSEDEQAEREQADRDLVEMLDGVWASIAELGDGLDEAAWKTPTECPGWTVQDNLVHVTALEAWLLGRPLPELDIPEDLPHVKNDFGTANERWITSRRDWSGSDALVEFRTVTAERIAVLRALGADGFGAESWTPLGPGTVRDLLPLRLFDSWVHEQDMRRAVGRPGDLESSGAAQVLTMMVDAMPFVIGKKVGVADGSSVVFTLTGPLARRVGIEVVERRARRMRNAPESATVALTMSTETFGRLACGRLDPALSLGDGALHDGALDDGRITIDGDHDLGRRIVEQMNYMF